jgi:hypothetical protein
MPPGQVRIVCIPSAADPVNGGANTSRTPKQVKESALASGYAFIGGYANLQELVDRIRERLAQETWTSGGMQLHGGCLEVLELYGHGSPLSCNGLWYDTVPWFAAQLKNTALCDEVNIYLTGCNTGLTRPYVVQDLSANPPIYRVQQSIAELLAIEMAFQPGVFEHRITVHGTCGYSSGTHVGGDNETFQTLEGGQTTACPMYHGARKASGNSCYNSFRNW